MSTSKTGKHGHAKCNFTAVDIFTGKKYEDMTPSSHNVDVRTRAYFHRFGFRALMPLLPGRFPTSRVRSTPFLT